MFPKWRCLHSTARLGAELSRSITALAGCHLYPEYFFTLPFPHSLRPLLRTVSVLHLASNGPTIRDWKCLLDRYLEKRFRESGDQVRYYCDSFLKAHRKLRAASLVFYICTGTAIVVSAIKCGCLFRFGLELRPEKIYPALGIFAVLLPVAAVGALSLWAVRQVLDCSSPLELWNQP